MKVPFLDLKAAHAELKAELDGAASRVIESGWFILGDEVKAFERDFAEYCGTKHCIGVGNGLDGLHLTLRAMGIGAGDEVIVPANTYIACWLAVSQSGAQPIPVEPHPRTYNLAPERIEAAITPQLVGGDEAKRAQVIDNLVGLNFSDQQLNFVLDLIGGNKGPKPEEEQQKKQAPPAFGKNQVKQASVNTLVLNNNSSKKENPTYFSSGFFGDL